MPMEAKESTTAIRRAVSEQINALKELSDIVAKSGRNIDVSEVRSAPRPRHRHRAPPSRRAARRSAASPGRRAAAPPVRRGAPAPAGRARGACRGTITAERPAEAPQRQRDARASRRAAGCAIC